MLVAQYIASILLLFGLGFTSWWLRRKWRAKKRQALYRQAIKPEWISILEQKVPLYQKLPQQFIPILHGHINYFLYDKHIVGRGGQTIDDTVRLTIAGNACLLVLTRHERIFPGFKTILVYPETYRGKDVHYDGMVKTHSHSARAGESWHRGPVVLAWSDVVRGSSNENDGHNVVLHEFAHKLDEENHLMDGLPVLQDVSQYSEWAEVLNREFDAFLDRVEKGQNKVIDSYGAVSPVEFFAVISEVFFEKPVQMQDKLPALYQQLARYYGVDTASW